MDIQNGKSSVDNISMKPKILFILHMPPPVHGAAMMGKYIHDSKVINEAFDCKYINLASAKTLQDIGKGGVRKFLNYLGLLTKVMKQVVTFRPRLVYVTPTACGIAFYKDFMVVQLLKLMGCKVVVHYHNKGVITRHDKKLDNWMYRLFFHKIKVILLADALYEDVRKYVRREDVMICPNGIPDVKDAIVRQYKHTATKLLFLSNLIESKGVFVLLDALKMLKDKGLDFSCDFVGAETQEINASRFRKEVEKRGLTPMVSYLGKKYGEEKEMLYQNADVFVFPTFYYNECFPLVLLEAMQHELPCISTDEGGIRDIIEDGKTGFVVEKNNPMVLAEKIELLLKNSDMCEQMGRNGYNLYQKHFTLQAFESKMKSCLENNL